MGTKFKWVIPYMMKDFDLGYWGQPSAVIIETIDDEDVIQKAKENIIKTDHCAIGLQTSDIYHWDDDDYDDITYSDIIIIGNPIQIR